MKPKNPNAVALGRLGGRKPGAKLTQKTRDRIATAMVRVHRERQAARVAAVMTERSK